MVLESLFLGLRLMKSYPAPAPHIVSGGRFAISIVPPRRDGKTIVPSKLRLFSVDEVDRERTLWRGRIGWMAHQAFISGDAHVVLMGQYPGSGDEHAVTILSDKGTVLADYSIGDLLTLEERQAMPADVWGERTWVKYGTFASIRNIDGPPPVTMPPVSRQIGEAGEIRNEYPLAFVVRTLSGRSLWFDLVTGKMYPSSVPRD